MDGEPEIGVIIFDNSGESVQVHHGPKPGAPKLLVTALISPPVASEGTNP